MGTISKALNLLSHFSARRGEIGLAEFTRLSGADKATVRRHLLELERNGFLERNAATREYRLGPALLRLASVREKHFPIRAAITPVVDGMAERLGELVHASLWQGAVMSPLYHTDVSRHGLRVIFDEAEVLPLHATASGLAMLAFGPASVADPVLGGTLASYTASTVIARSDLMALIEVTCARGYSQSDEFYTSGVVSYAMPFFGPSGSAIGTLAVPFPRSRYSAELEARVLQELRDGCRTVSRVGGGAVPAELNTLWDRLPPSTATEAKSQAES